MQSLIFRDMNVGLVKIQRKVVKGVQDCLIGKALPEGFQLALYPLKPVTSQLEDYFGHLRIIQTFRLLSHRASN